MKFYRENCWKLKWWILGFLGSVIFLPWILLLLIYLSMNNEYEIFSAFKQNYIEILTYISWFLFAWLSILLTNTVFDDWNVWKIWDKYKGYVMRYWGVNNENCQNKDKVTEWVNKWIKKYKFSLLLDVLSIVIVSIFAIILSIFWDNSILLMLIMYLFILCCVQLMILIPRIISYLKVVEFNIK